MLLTPHTLVGIAVATSVHNPLIAIPLSFGLHFVGDMVPHWDPYAGTDRDSRLKGWRPLAVMADMGIGIAVGTLFTSYALFALHNPTVAFNIAGSGIASVLPDILTGPSIYIEGANGISKFIHKIQGKLQFQVPFVWGMLSQTVIVGVSLLLILGSLTQ